MNTYRVASFQSAEDYKWLPAGMIYKNDYDNANIKEVEFTDRFDTKENADDFFRNHYNEMGYKEIK